MEQMLRTVQTTMTEGQTQLEENHRKVLQVDPARALLVRTPPVGQSQVSEKESLGRLSKKGHALTGSEVLSKYFKLVAW